MSTKIWEAYRLKKGVNLWEFIHDVRIKAEYNTQRRLVEVYRNIIGQCDNSSAYNNEVINEAYGPNDKRMKCDVFIASSYVSRLYSLGRAFDFDASITIRQHAGRYYIIPHDNNYRVLKFLKDDPRLEDYHYQNQSDKPKNISNSAWTKRRQVWDKIFGDNDDKWWDALVLEIVCKGNFYRVNPVYTKPHMIKSLRQGG